MFSAIILGGASGLAATGTDQIIKQAGKKEEKGEEDGNDDKKE